MATARHTRRYTHALVAFCVVAAEQQATGAGGAGSGESHPTGGPAAAVYQGD